MTYEEAATYISEVPKFTKKNELSNTVELLRRLGHPEEQFRVIHVAGTNGKGSVCAFMAAVLQHAGYKTGLFVSPHLVKINERFQVNRHDVSDAAFTGAFQAVKETIDEMTGEGFPHPTYFEILFAVGMVLFAREKIDILVMETGMGGRLDATNTVAHPEICVITSVSLDHTEYLGDTVEKIAFEKAGIIKEGVPVVYDCRCREAGEVIRAQAERMHAPAWPYYQEMSEITGRTQSDVSFVLNNRLFDYQAFTVPFPADYQVVNSSLALMALRLLDPQKTITDRMMAEGILRTRWSGRMETAMPGVVLDGAHNADGIRQFLKTVNLFREKKPVSLLFAAVIEKDYENMVREICEETEFSHIIVTQIEGDRRTDASALAGLFRKYTDTPVEAVKSVPEAFEKALAQKGEGVLFCAGSLYLIGEIKEVIAGIKARGEKIND